MPVLCLSCLNPLQNINQPCPNCGWFNGHSNQNDHLVAGSILANRYVIGNALGQGSCSVVYIGWSIVKDNNDNWSWVPNSKVAIKEFFPNRIASRINNGSTVIPRNNDNAGNLFRIGREKFLSEAQILAQLDRDPNIVKALDFFQENNTSYIVMEYLEGQTLLKYMQNVNRPLALKELFNIMDPVVDALERLHAKKILHRDISPSNIMMSHESVKILDFGAARSFTANDNDIWFEQSSYAPEEQFITHGRQGPWTDEYALAATIYHAITAHKPMNLMQRNIQGNRDNLTMPSQFGIQLSPEREKILLKGMAMNYKKRYPNVRKFYNAFKSGRIPTSLIRRGSKFLISTLLGEIFDLGDFVDWIPIN